MDSKDFSKIIADLSYVYENAEEFGDFVARYNIGVPAAYLIHNKLVSRPTADCKRWILEAWEVMQESGLVLEEA
jgi:hypothetical protein